MHTIHMDGVVAESLSRRFGARVAVDHVDLRIAPGEILALLGPNGAGKTTTVRMIAALLRPTAGRCRVAGYDVVRDADQVRQIIGLMTDVPGLCGEMELRAYLLWFAGLYQIPARMVDARVDAVIDRFGLSDWGRSPLSSLSRGTQQKVALARSLLHDPQVLLLDEPTASLDVEATLALRVLFRTLKEARRAIVLCTHNLAEAEKVADAVAILINGRIVYRQRLADAGAPQTYRVRLAPSAPVDLAVLGTVSGVEGGSVRWRAPGAIEFATRIPEETNPRVAAALVSAGVGLVELARGGESLEEIYMRSLQEAGHANDPAHRR
jgi:ABC-2 type transport system ATP-binding protein